MIERPRIEVMKQMLNGNNLALVSTRQLSGAGLDWSHVFVSNAIVESCFISNRTREINYIYPMCLYHPDDLQNKVEKRMVELNE